MSRARTAKAKRTGHAARCEVSVFGLDASLSRTWGNSAQRALRGTISHLEVAVIVWTTDSICDKARLWRPLTVKLENAANGLRIIVVIPELTPDWFEAHELVAAPKLLLQALIADARRTADYADVSAAPWTSVDTLPKAFREERCGITWDSSNLPNSQLYRLCKVMAGFPERVGDGYEKKTKEGASRKDKANEVLNSPVDATEFARFVRNPRGFRARHLHGATAGKTQPDGGPNREERSWTRTLRLFQYLASRIVVPPSLRLKVLIVENDPEGLVEWNEKVGREHTRLDLGGLSVGDALGYLQQAEYFFVAGYEKRETFEQFRTNSGRDSVRAVKYIGSELDARRTGKPQKIPWDEIDLVLQDIMLGGNTNEFTGLDLVPHYLEACPQALVILLTGMDVESLVMSGDINWQYVDAAISKRRLDTLWWEYYRCFRERFGRMFWPEWSTVPEENGFASRKDLRRLFGCLRKWQMEPAILGHGQGVPEMIDHAERHIGCLWRLADDFLGELLENSTSGECLSLGNRVVFALALWLHDTGHRGDEYHDDPADVRMFHAGISERLLLRDPASYGLEWLLSECTPKCRAADPVGQQRRLSGCRNKPASAKDSPCRLRQVGLLCRHHQSNAPLSKNALSVIQQRGKTISPYARTQRILNTGGGDYEKELELWTDPTKPLEDWCGSDVITLQDFLPPGSSLLSVAGLLRMLDGIQVHRKRVGSPTAAKSFEAYLSNRSKWASRQIRLLDSMLAQIVPGTRGYLSTLAKRQQLENYRRIVHVQHIHYWRQLAVDEVEVRWKWQPNGNGAIELGFVLDDWALGEIKEATVDVQATGGSRNLMDYILKPQAARLAKEPPGREVRDALAEQINNHPLQDEVDWWALHVRDDLLRKEHDSQLPVGGGAEPYLKALAGHQFRVSLLGLASMRFLKAVSMFEAPLS